MPDFNIEINNTLQQAPKKKKSEAWYRAQAKWESKVYDKTLLRLPKGELDALKELSQSIGESVNSFINKAIEERIERINAERKK